MERLRETTEERIETPFVVNLLFDLSRTLCKWAEVEPQDIDVVVNGLLPLAEHKGEERIRPLTLIELSTIAHLEAALPIMLDKYSVDDETIEFQILTELMRSMRSCIMGMAVLGHEIKLGHTSFHGLRRQYNRAVWIKRVPDQLEREAALAFMLASGIDPNEEGGEESEPTKH